MPPRDERLWQELNDIKDMLRTVQRDIGTIKVELGKHHEKFKFMHERIERTEERMDKACLELDEAKKEVRDFRIWVLTAAIAGLLSLVGIMFGVIRWLFERM